ncbi:dihydrolipoyllysine-residue acetyltransferase component of pyruvate dehydrogenase complex-like [Schistocerca americana]|uniref:dihydrolipoyllysine-residue acetyltransferase component of pyruvate dehydrogenase complex-like n=1 Tax=Schistocerca americana TaxID=7009 RepID=UPI001F503334|nr:dihydrolipoyllysine-residue acetyltransferase component of pyruvate dehydrogenase complex-like [Schistocerca americana]
MMSIPCPANTSGSGNVQGPHAGVAVAGLSGPDGCHGVRKVTARRIKDCSTGGRAARSWRTTPTCRNEPSAAVLSTQMATTLVAPAAVAAPAIAYTAPAAAVVAAPAPVAYAAPAAAGVAAAPGSTVVSAPGTSFYSSSTQSVHPPQVVLASPQAVHATAVAAAPVVAAAPAVATAPAVVAAPPAEVVDAPEVVAARAAHFQAYVAAKAALLGRKKRSPGFLGPAVVSTPAATTLSAHAAPVDNAVHAASVALAAHAAAVTPVAYSAPVAVAYSAPAAVTYSAPASVAYSAVAFLPVAASSQYRVQDQLGQYTYGYADGNSAKTESRAADGSTVGGYSYVDDHALVQSVKYHADSLGFRATATNLPVLFHFELYIVYVCNLLFFP